MKQRRKIINNLQVLLTCLFALDSTYASNLYCKHLISMIIYKYIQFKMANLHHSNSECKAKVIRKCSSLVIKFILVYVGNFIVKLSNEADFPVLFWNIFTAEWKGLIWAVSKQPTDDYMRQKEMQGQKLHSRQDHCNLFW